MIVVEEIRLLGQKITADTILHLHIMRNKIHVILRISKRQY